MTTKTEQIDVRENTDGIAPALFVYRGRMYVVAEVLERRRGDWTVLTNDGTHRVRRDEAGGWLYVHGPIPLAHGTRVSVHDRCGTVVVDEALNDHEGMAWVQWDEDESRPSQLLLEYVRGIEVMENQRIAVPYLVWQDVLALLERNAGPHDTRLVQAIKDAAEEAK